MVYPSVLGTRAAMSLQEQPRAGLWNALAGDTASGDRGAAVGKEVTRVTVGGFILAAGASLAILLMFWKRKYNSGHLLLQADPENVGGEQLLNNEGPYFSFLLESLSVLKCTAQCH